MNFFTQSISRDFAHTLGNGAYAIMMGLAVTNYLANPGLADWPPFLHILFLFMLFYYILDWLSYNAFLEINATLSHGNLIAYMVSLLAFGASLVFTTRLMDNVEGIGKENAWAIRTFEVFLFLYITVTAVGSHLLTGKAIRAQDEDASWAHLASVLRIIAAVCILLLLLYRWFESDPASFSTILWAYTLSVFVLVTAKFIGYEYTLLPKL